MTEEQVAMNWVLGRLKRTADGFCTQFMGEIDEELYDRVMDALYGLIEELE